MDKDNTDFTLGQPLSHHSPFRSDCEADRAFAADFCKDATLKSTELFQLPQLMLDYWLTGMQTMAVLMSI